MPTVAYVSRCPFRRRDVATVAALNLNSGFDNNEKTLQKKNPTQNKTSFGAGNGGQKRFLSKYETFQRLTQPTNSHKRTFWRSAAKTP
jgi:hypothetical protein